MKPNIMIAMLGMLVAGPVLAQQTGKEKSKEEVIIKKKGTGDEKTTIVIDGDKITVNGKPLAEYSDGDIIIHKKEIDGLQREMQGQQFEMELAQRDMQRSMEEMRRNMPKMMYRYRYSPDDMDFDIDNDMKGNIRISRGEPKAFLGVGLEKGDKGVKITDVSKGSAAEKAGLKAGDMITKFGGKAVTGPEELTEMVRAKKPNEEVEISYLKAGDKKERKVKVKLGETKSQVMVFDSEDFAPMPPAPPRAPRAPRAPISPEGELWAPEPPAPPMDPDAIFHGFHWEGSKPELGLRIQDTDESNGVKVLDVNDGSLAATAGVKENDIITEIDGKAVKNTDDARDVLRAAKEKTSYPIKVLRNGSPMNLEVKVPKKLKKADL